MPFSKSVLFSRWTSLITHSVPTKWIRLTFLVIFFGVVLLSLPAHLKLTLSKSANAAVNTFIKRSEDILFDDLNGNGVQEENEPPFRFIGFNVTEEIIGGDIGGDGKPDPWMQEDTCKSMVRMGVNTIRLYIVTAGQSIMPYSRMVTAPGTFNEDSFRVLDKMLQLCNQYGIRVIIPLIDRYHYQGGVPVYANWRGKGLEDFWTDTTVRNDFKSTINYLLNRTNYYTGVQYKNDKAILAWETGNELYAADWTKLAPWTSDIAAYIKDIDSNHLVMDGCFGINPMVIDDPNIDIVSDHYYHQIDSRDYAARCREDRNASRLHKKPFVIGEFGMIGEEGGSAHTTKYTNLINEVINNGTTGAMIWKYVAHSVNGGYNEHSGIDSLQFAWPPSPQCSLYDEVGTMNMMRNKAYQIRGQAVPAITAPEAPVLLGISYVDSIKWKAGSGAETYDVERAASSDGPWTVVGADVTDNISVLPPFKDTSAVIGNSYYYRVKAKNSAGVSSYSNVIGPATAQLKPLPTIIVDEMRDFKIMYSYTNNLRRGLNSASYFHNDGDRFLRSSHIPAQYDNIVYKLGTDITYFRLDSFYWPYETVVDFNFYTSPDGINYTQISPAKYDGGGDWNYITYTQSSGIPAGARYLKIEFRNTSENCWTPQISRVEMNTRIVDELNDFGKVYSHTANMEISVASPSFFNGDTSRLARLTSTYENIIYKTDDSVDNRVMTGFMVDTYFWPHEPIQDMRFYASPDGSTYTQVTPTVNNLGGDWTRIKYVTTSLPLKTKYLKIEFRNTSANYWTPQISRIEIDTARLFIDDCNNLYNTTWPNSGELNSNIMISTGSSSYFNGDTARFVRFVSTQDYINYSAYRPISLMLDTYFWGLEPVVDFKLYSADGSEVTPTRNSLGGDWPRYVYNVASFPAFTRGVKIRFMNTSANYWTPQISRIEIIDQSTAQ
jgi:Cellulase (glycosyl hydrolase family 5)